MWHAVRGHAHLVYSCLEVQFLQESLCSLVWNECSRPEVAALAGYLSVLAQEQAAALRGWAKVSKES